MSIVESMKKRRQEKGHSLADLVARAARGKVTEFGEEEERILVLESCSIKRFGKLIERQKIRDASSEAFNEAKTLRKLTLPGLQQEAKDAEQAVEALREKHKQELREAQEKFEDASKRRNALTNKIDRQSREARKQLLATADPSIDEELKGLRSQANEINQLIPMHQRNIRNRKAELEKLNREEHAGNEIVDRGQTERMLTEQQDVLANRQAELSKIRQDIESLEDEN